MTTANRREHTATAVGHAVRSGAPAVARLSLSALGGWLIAGWLGALFGALGALVAMLSGELAGAYVVAGVVLTGAATLFEARYGGAFASARFVRGAAPGRRRRTLHRRVVAGLAHRSPTPLALGRAHRGPGRPHRSPRR
jgi:hypothetical protein